MGQKHGLLSGEISTEVEDVFCGDLRLSGSLKFRWKEKGNSVIVTSNIYLKEKTQLYKFLSDITSVVEAAIKRHLALDGEIIKLNIKGGTVSDRGEVWFDIVEGVIFEVYCFVCKSISFVRILHERQLYGEENE
ncbi:MAG: hypothetical protein QXS27_01175, partial [Candidatus Jordarchaeaceae archaeon]